jgi:glycosyltransferase involved in cell wall biosynthesis
MRIAHVVVAGEIGGAERMLVTLATSPESQAEHKVLLLTPSHPLRQMFLRAGLTVHDRGLVQEGPLAFVWQQLGPLHVGWLREELAAARPDVVHLHTLGSQVIGTRAALRLHLPIVRTEHSTRVLDDRTAWPFARWSLRRAHASVAISAHVKERFAQKAPWAEEKLRTIPNGIDTDHFALAPALPAGKPLTLLFLGRLEPRKGADLALAAVARVPGVRLLVCGDGQDRTRIAALVAELGLQDRVELRGLVDDASTVIPEAHAIIASSRAEGLGIAFLEAMSMGRPVVGLATGGIRELTDASSALVSVPSEGALDAERFDLLASRIRDAKTSIAALPELGIRARAKVLDTYSSRAMAAAYADVYAKVTAARR